MYQTVGHQGVELYAEAMGLPLYRQQTQGVALQMGKVYTPTEEDEVEDLYRLLKHVKVRFYQSILAIKLCLGCQIVTPVVSS